MPTSVVILGTLDTKGDECAYIKRLVEESGCTALVVDVGTLNPPAIEADISREKVVEAAGLSVEKLRASNDRRLAVETVTRGGGLIAGELHSKGALSGIISVGGGTGTHIAAGVMRSLPLGVPKLIVSTVASRDMGPLVGTKDITVMHSVTDILGLNAISRRILGNAASAIVGMAKSYSPITPDRPVIGLTSFGFITEAAMRIKGLLEDLGFDVAAFHANGVGGMAMEDLIEQGLIDGVLDLALHEFSDELYDGYCGGIGPGRLEGAAKRGIPQVVVPGGLDCIVLEFSSLETMPDNVRGRKVFWYDFRSGVRTSSEDVVRLARIVAEKLNAAKGPTKFLVPMRGWSEADAEGRELYEPETNQAFLLELKLLLESRIEIIEIDAHICDEAFSKAVVAQVAAMMGDMTGQFPQP